MENHQIINCYIHAVILMLNKNENYINLVHSWSILHENIHRKVIVLDNIQTISDEL